MKYLVLALVVFGLFTVANAAVVNPTATPKGIANIGDGELWKIVDGNVTCYYTIMRNNSKAHPTNLSCIK